MKTTLAAALLSLALSGPAAAQVAGPEADGRAVEAAAAPAAKGSAGVPSPAAEAPMPARPSADPAAAPVGAAPSGAPASLYIAGDRFSLEQAFADAALDKLNAAGSGAFVIVATERESVKLTLKGAKPNVKNAVRQLQRAGGTFYLCERDVRQAGFEAKDLLPGVKIERGLKKQELQATGVEAAQAGPVRRIRRVCS